MDELIIMLKNVVLFVALAIPGFLLVKGKILTPADCNPLSKILLHVAMPFLIFSSTLDITLTPQTAIDFAFAAAITLVGILGTYLLSVPLSKIEKTPRQRGVTRFSMVFPNNGFLGLPLASALFAQVMPNVVAYLVIINIMTNLMILILGSYTISGEKKYISFKGILTSPVLIAFCIGIVVNLTKVCDVVPEIKSYSGHLKNLVTPLSMTIIGMKFGQMSFKELLSDKKLYAVSLVRLVVFPVLLVGVLFLLRLVMPVTDQMILAVFIGFAMPIAALITTLADKFGIEGNSATIYVLGTTLFSVVTIPVLYSLLTMLL